MVKRWKAHKDAINWITWTPELRIIGSCSYDCNVFLWNTECAKVGSLVLGNKATAPNQELDPETARYRKGWKISIDKLTRFQEELDEARDLWAGVEQLDYKELKAKAIERRRKQERLNTADKSHENAVMEASLRNAQAATLRRKNQEDEDPHGEYEGLTGEEADAKMLSQF